jgi:hypothetical protein
MSIGVSRSVRVIHNRYKTKLNSTQDFKPTFPRTPLTSSWGEHEGERPCTTVLYFPCIWCSSNDQKTPKSVCVRLWVGSDTSHLVRSPRPSNRHVNITATETTCQLRTPTNTTGRHARAWRGGDTSVTLSMNLSVCAGVVRTSYCLDWTQLKQEFGSIDMPLSSTSPRRGSVHVCTQNPNNAAAFECNTTHHTASCLR